MVSAAKQHLIANQTYYKAAGDTQRAIGDAKENQEKVAGRKTYEHDCCRVITCPVCLLLALSNGHALGQTDIERDLR